MSDREFIVVRPGRSIRLADIDPAAAAGLDKETAKARLAKDALRIGTLQERLYAEGRRALLIVLQGMDTSGKDGTIRNVFDAVNPIGLRVAAFGRPSDEELKHDFLWRIYRELPAMGHVGAFNRSHYEDVLVPRVKKLVAPAVWKRRYDQINQFEALVSDLGIRLVKVFLHISREEQKERLLARVAERDKHFKFRLGDLDDRALWKEFHKAYEDSLERCSTKVAPWHIVPADKKWFRNAAVARLVADELAAMRPVPVALDLDPKTIRIPD